jgi:RNA polymerase sigma-70 factor (ECF subfamily)
VPNQKEIEKAFIAKIKLHEGIIHKIGFVYAQNKEDKEDLSQEIILQVWKSYPSFKGKSTLSTWIYRVALNTALTINKKKSIIKSFRKHQPVIHWNEEANSYSQKVKILYRGIACLEKVEKALILLWLEEKSYLEIGEIIGISEKNVSVKLVRIRKKLGDIINKMNE